MRGHLLRDLQSAAVLEVGGDAGRAERALNLYTFSTLLADRRPGDHAAQPEKVIKSWPDVA